MFHLYILQLSNGNYYVGQTNNLEARLQRHVSRQVRATKAYLPLKLVYKERYVTRSESMARERQIKSWKSHKAIDILIENNMASSSNG